jgi:hypothetical protein
MRTHHIPTTEEVLDRMPPIPEEARSILEVMADYQAKIDERQILSIEAKDLRVEVYLKP